MRRHLLLLIIITPLLYSNSCILLRSVKKEKSLKEKVIENIWYISTSEQRKKLKKLETEEQLKIFLNEFWMNLDPTPETEENEFKTEYNKRYH